MAAKSVIVAYALWLVFGLLGGHFLYIRRFRHWFLWFSTAGGFLVGWALSDPFRLQAYVGVANRCAAAAAAVAAGGAASNSALTAAGGSSSGTHSPLPAPYSGASRSRFVFSQVKHFVAAFAVSVYYEWVAAAAANFALSALHPRLAPARLPLLHVGIAAARAFAVHLCFSLDPTKRPISFLRCFFPSVVLQMASAVTAVGGAAGGPAAGPGLAGAAAADAAGTAAGAAAGAAAGGGGGGGGGVLLMGGRYEWAPPETLLCALLSDAELSPRRLLLGQAQFAGSAAAACALTDRGGAPGSERPRAPGGWVQTWTEALLVLLAAAAWGAVLFSAGSYFMEHAVAAEAPEAGPAASWTRGEAPWRFDRRGALEEAAPDFREAWGAARIFLLARARRLLRLFASGAPAAAGAAVASH